MGPSSGKYTKEQNMSLFKQLALLLSILLLIILATVMSIEFSTSIENAEHQLHIDAQNTASSLSLSLATAEGDESIMATMINANFDSGHYSRIRLEDMTGAVIYERHENIRTLGVPEWFIKLVDLHVEGASAQVSAGWMVIGTLIVESDLSQTYYMLYKMLQHLLFSFALFMVVSLMVLYILLYTLLRPLKRLQEQAEAISKNEFEYQKTLPYTTEFREIVLSMNTMVKKVEGLFKSNLQVIEQNRKKLYTEKLPKLYNEHYLMLKCHEECMENSEFDGGAVLMLELNVETVAEETDYEALFMTLASVVITKSKKMLNQLVSRVQENRIVLLMPGATELEACSIQEAILENFIDKAEVSNYQLKKSLYRFGAHEKCEQFLEKTAQMLDEKGSDICRDQKEAMRYKEQLTQEDWSYLIATALRKENFSYEVRNVIDMSQNSIYDRGISIVMHGNNGTVYPYGRFIGPAVKAHKVLDIYMQVIKVMVQNFSSNEKQGRYTFSFANALLLEARTFGILQKEFEGFENIHNIDFCIELPERFIVSDLESAKRYVSLIKQHGYRFGIGEFSTESDNIDYLELLKPEFIKISKIFLLDLIDNSAPLLSSLQMATDTLGIQIIATGVSSKEELEKIQGAGISIVQGMITEVM